MTNDLEQVLTAYESWLLRQPLAKKTQDAYRFHVRQYGAYLATRSSKGSDPLHDPFARDKAGLQKGQYDGGTIYSPDHVSSLDRSRT